jgi:hypothetical protein
MPHGVHRDNRIDRPARALGGALQLLSQSLSGAQHASQPSQVEHRQSTRDRAAQRLGQTRDAQVTLGAHCARDRRPFIFWSALLRSTDQSLPP